RDEWSNNPYFHFNNDIVKMMENTILQSANLVVAITSLANKNYQNNFNISKNKLITITNGYDEDDFSGIVPKKQKNERFTIIHNGMLYSRTIEPFLVALSSLIEEGKIKKNKINVHFNITCNR